MPKCELAFYTALEHLDNNGPDGNRKDPKEQEFTIASQQLNAAMLKAEKALERLQQADAKRKQPGDAFLNGCLFAVPYLGDGLLHTEIQVS